MGRYCCHIVFFMRSLSAAVEAATDKMNKVKEIRKLRALCLSSLFLCFIFLCLSFSSTFLSFSLRSLFLTFCFFLSLYSAPNCNYSNLEVVVCVVTLTVSLIAADRYQACKPKEHWPPLNWQTLHTKLMKIPGHVQNFRHNHRLSFQSFLFVMIRF